jgi:xanthine dehydrogenase YagR molybdenum-binding subunit
LAEIRRRLPFPLLGLDSDNGGEFINRTLVHYCEEESITLTRTMSQLRGGIVMGMGIALSEETLLDPRTGRIMNPSLSEYHVPVHADVPPIDVYCLDEPDPTVPLGGLGAGEVGIIGVAGAIANAVYHATGKRIYDLPITLDKLL